MSATRKHWKWSEEAKARASARIIASGEKSGANNGNWTGETPINDNIGHKRARKMYPITGLCQKCGVKPATQRSHKDNNPKNNAPDNIELLCAGCHPEADGRLDKLKVAGKIAQKKFAIERGKSGKRDQRGRFVKGPKAPEETIK